MLKRLFGRERWSEPHLPFVQSVGSFPRDSANHPETAGLLQIRPQLSNIVEMNGFAPSPVFLRGSHTEVDPVVHQINVGFLPAKIEI